MKMKLYPATCIIKSMFTVNKSGLQTTTRPLANASNFYLWATKTLGFDRPHSE